MGILYIVQRTSYIGHAYPNMLIQKARHDCHCEELRHQVGRRGNPRTEIASPPKADRNDGLAHRL